jgi:uncharacterized protein YbcI
MTQEERERGGLARAVRTIVIWVVVLIVAVGVGFGTGYFFRDKEARGLEETSAKKKEELTAQIGSLEKQVLEAEKSQLERTLVRVRMQASLEEVLQSLTKALAEVDERNFGRAKQRIEAAKGALSAATGTPPAVRDAIGAQLNEITAGIDTLDVTVREKIATLAKELEEGRAPKQISQ